MNFEGIIFELAIVLVGAAALGTLFLYIRQPIIIAYIAVGFAVGSNGLKLVRSADHIEKIGHFGVMLLLFLIGLSLQPGRLVKLLRKAFLLTFATAALFGLASFLFARLLRIGPREAAVFGAAMMFSSTVVGLKLTPTTTLHHKRTGEIMTSVLLLQDLLAILLILFLTGKKEGAVAPAFIVLSGKLILVCVLSFAGVRYIMMPLLRKFDVVQEYTFVVTLGWCLLWAELARISGLSYEMGAFIAGLSIASCRVALVIAEHLKPLREFFLILFFFAIGAKLSPEIAPPLLLASIVFGVVLVPLKAFVFRFAFRRSGEPPAMSRELAVRLAQASEFSLLLAFVAASAGILSASTSMTIQITTIVTFIVSTYWVVLRYPTPISADAALRQD